MIVDQLGMWDDDGASGLHANVLFAACALVGLAHDHVERANHRVVFRERIGDRAAVGKGPAQDQWWIAPLTFGRKFVGELRNYSIVIGPGDGDHLVAGTIDDLHRPVDEPRHAPGRHITGLLRSRRIDQRNNVLVDQNSIHLRESVLIVVDESRAQPVQLEHPEGRTSSQQDLDQVRGASFDQTDVGVAFFQAMIVHPLGGQLVGNFNVEMPLGRRRERVDHEFYPALEEKALLGFPG